MTAADATLPAKPKRPARPPNLQPRPKTAVVVGITAVAVLAAIVVGRPQLNLLFMQPLWIQLHVYAAVSTFILGTVLILARKGRTFHIRMGWTWVALMGTTAFASLFIVGLNGDWWSWIHILTGLTLLNLPFAVMAARKHNVARHRQLMTSLYVGGMLIAGGFTFIPGRLMWRVFVGD